jgi:hypothetical protein
MKTHLVITAVLLVLFPVMNHAQTAGAKRSLADQSWPTFWRRFTTAINNKDREALKKMMPDDFDDGGGGLPPDEWLQYIDENERNGSWRDLRRSFAQGTRPDKRPAGGIPTRVTKDRGYYFEFRKDKKWYFAAIAGD